MGIDYRVKIGIGFHYDQAEALRPFAREWPEESGWEDRFDPRTGAKLAPVRVIVKRAKIEYELPGLQPGDPPVVFRDSDPDSEDRWSDERAVEHLAALVGAQITVAKDQ